MTKLEIGHKTVLEIEPGKMIMYVGEHGNVPLELRLDRKQRLPLRENEPKKPVFKKVRYAGSPD